MFQFPGFPSLYLFYSVYDNVTLLTLSSLIRTSAALCSFAAPRGFSQLVASFFGAMYQGILLYALCSLIFLSSLIALSQSVEFTFYISLTSLLDYFFSSDSFLRFFLRINLSSFIYSLFLLFALMYYFFKSFSSIIIY